MIDPCLTVCLAMTEDGALMSALFVAIGTLSGAVVFLWKQQNKVLSESIRLKDEQLKALRERELKLEEQVRDLTRRVFTLEVEKKDLEAKFMIFSSTHDNSPIPAWIKDTSGRVLSCNKAYEDAFLKPRGYTMIDYVGSDDFAVWPKVIADSFRENDEMVRRSKTVWSGEEKIENADGSFMKTRIIKYPRMIPGQSEPFGIAGVAPDIVMT